MLRILVTALCALLAGAAIGMWLYEYRPLRCLISDEVTWS